MFQSYFEVFYSLLVGDTLRTLKDPSLLIPIYQLLLLATSQLMGDNKKFSISVIFWVFFSLLMGDIFSMLKHLSLVTPSYQLLPIATDQLMGDNRQMFHDILRCFTHNWNIEDLSLVILGYQMLPLATSQVMGDNMKFDIFRTLKIHHLVALVTNCCP